MQTSVVESSSGLRCPEISHDPRLHDMKGIKGFYYPSNQFCAMAVLDPPRRNDIPEAKSSGWFHWTSTNPIPLTSNTPAVWSQIRWPAGVSCGSGLFVVVLSVLSLVLSSPWRGFSPRLTWTPPLRPLPPPPPSPPLSPLLTSLQLSWCLRTNHVWSKTSLSQTQTHAHTHTLAQNCISNCWGGVYPTCKPTNSPRQTGSSCSSEFWMFEGASQNQIAKTVQDKNHSKWSTRRFWA